ncbi:hypothetical protein CAOG_009769 [Capsaspora owczarzaki ATCC 30864]|uniref:Uncharacterized protein n=1 Tax=Capsaspora owczarzaki (strain ATCC 30864) TaxID=595528 RepID=A0A0D2WR87_CAPO3|nr:hypothetical protein CAOG_009769 [Capsaspora owczarzaki ATCC 30864]
MKVCPNALSASIHERIGAPAPSRAFLGGLEQGVTEGMRARHAAACVGLILGSAGGPPVPQCWL